MKIIYQQIYEHQYSRYDLLFQSSDQQHCEDRMTFSRIFAGSPLADEWLESLGDIESNRKSSQSFGQLYRQVEIAKGFNLNKTKSLLESKCAAAEEIVFSASTFLSAVGLDRSI